MSVDASQWFLRRNSAVPMRLQQTVSAFHRCRRPMQTGKAYAVDHWLQTLRPELKQEKENGHG